MSQNRFSRVDKVYRVKARAKTTGLELHYFGIMYKLQISSSMSAKITKIG